MTQPWQKFLHIKIRIWAIIDNDVLLPCIFIGPITEQFLREMYRRDGEIKEEKIDELISNLWDWDWDSVIVKPLVEVETELGEISSETTAQRIYIFPYKKLKL